MPKLGLKKLRELLCVRSRRRDGTLGEFTSPGRELKKWGLVVFRFNRPQQRRIARAARKGNELLERRPRR